MPLPATNVVVAGELVDCFWPQQGLVVELDSFAFHRSRSAFERDRARDASLALAGHPVMRVTDLMLEREPAAVANRLMRMLGLARLAA